MSPPSPDVVPRVRVSPTLLAGSLLAVCFTLATELQLGPLASTGSDARGGLLGVLLGDTRRILAAQFIVQADVSLHGGYYPSVFDAVERPQKPRVATTDSATAPGKPPAASEHEGHDGPADHDDLPAFLHPPQNWIERFGRYFYPSEHVHLERPTDAAELLPWLLMASEMDPHRIDTYSVTAFWLRKRLNRPRDAEQFLRAGLRENPENPELLFELGRIFQEEHRDSERARHVWEAALRRRQAEMAREAQPETQLLASLLAHLGDLEEKRKQYAPALRYFEMLKPLSPAPEAIQKRIEEIRRAQALGAPASPAPR